MTVKERTEEAIKQLARRMDIRPGPVLEWLRGEIETQIRGAMKDQREACAQSALDVVNPARDERHQLYQAVMSAEVNHERE
jgi:hypothetical protein